MDGNGRWAKRKGLPRAAGHKAGVEAVRETVKAASEAGVSILTLYAFSQENWKRPREEVSILMNLLDFFLDHELKALVKEGVSFRTIGKIEVLPPKILQKVLKMQEATRDNNKLILNIALNYGARTEILDAVQKVLASVKNGQIAVNGHVELSEKDFSKYLYTADLPDPDLLIRTSGEMRLSNFLLWQLSYSEIYITKKYWPDFGKKDFLEALHEYARRERRFGGIEA